MNKKVNKALKMDKFKDRIKVIWEMGRRVCVIDIKTGQIKVIEVN